MPETSNSSAYCFENLPPNQQARKIYDQLVLLNENLSTGTVRIVEAPSGGDPFTDFSMFPGGVAPTSGSYIAFDENWIWTFIAGVDTVWQQSPRST